MRSRLGAVLVAAAAWALSTPLAAAADPHTESASSGQVQATFTYDRAGDIDFRSLHLRIVRAGVPLLDEDLAAACDMCWPASAGEAGRSSVRVVDLDGDGEPEVLLDLYTGGAHCCSISRIYRYRASPAGYDVLSHDWADPGYRLRDLDPGGPPVLVSADARFAYAFTSFAASAFPPQLFAYRAGALRDVTRSHPQVVARDARRERRELRSVERRADGDVRGVLAALVADLDLLGRRDAGRRIVGATLRAGYLSRGPRAPDLPAGRAYVRRLERFLRRAGYVG